MESPGDVTHSLTFFLFVIVLDKWKSTSASCNTIVDSDIMFLARLSAQPTLVLSHVT